MRRLQQETEEALSAYAYHGGSPMAYFSDVSEYLQLAKVGSTLSMKALLTIAEGLRAARTVRNALVSDREDTRTLSAIASELATNRPLEEEIFNAILSEDEMADRASPELYDIRRRLRALNDRVRDRLNAIIRSSSLQKYLQDAIITMRNGRYVIPVRADSRQFVPGLVHDQSGSGSTLFIEPAAVVEAGNEIKQWTLKERQEIDRILGEFTDRVAPDADLYRHNIEVLANLDMIFARAALAREMRAAPPKINEEGRVNLMRARHPLIDPEKVVPSTLWMGGEFTTLVITGPQHWRQDGDAEDRGAACPDGAVRPADPRRLWQRTARVRRGVRRHRRRAVHRAVASTFSSAHDQHRRILQGGSRPSRWRAV